MSLNGALTDFPVPEVLLFIGSRTGRLRLYDVPKFAVMELELDKGDAHALYLGGSLLTETSEIVAELSVITESGEGKFEFVPQPVVPLQREQPFQISELVMALVMHVDAKVAQRRPAFSPDHIYVLEEPAPEIWIDPTLNFFYQQSLDWLKYGVQTKQLADDLGLPEDLVRLNLTYLRQLGFVRTIDAAEAEELEHQKLQEAISAKTNEYQFAAEASDLIRRSGKLLKLPKRKVF